MRGGGPCQPFTLSRSHLNIFIRVVTEAPENKDEFPMRVLHLLGALAQRKTCLAAEMASLHGTTLEEVESVFRDFADCGLCLHDAPSNAWILTPGMAKTYFELQRRVTEAGIDLRRLLVQAPMPPSPAVGSGSSPQ